jgi:sugar fermentation stimulation protein A
VKTPQSVKADQSVKTSQPAKAAPFVKLFSNDLEAVFVRRPNRFLIIAKHRGKEIPCHCPNPGRLIEFFGFRGHDIPGIKLILEKRTARAKAKTAWTAVGLYYTDALTKKEAVVPLFSSRANRAAELLILKEIIPGITETRTEYTIGGSRFDFCCTDARGRRHLVEVKACSLVEYGTAMFPDAPSERALKHLEELAELSGGYICHVLFVIVHGGPSAFVPNLHTDPVLAAGLSRLGTAENPAGKTAAANRAAVKPKRGRPVLVHAALLSLDREGGAALASPSVPVDLRHGALAQSDGGSYLIALELSRQAEIETGSLGKLRFPAGWYVYAGSARKNLSRRVNRHLRKTRKQKHWHLDYLVPFAKTIKALPFLSYRNLECLLAGELHALGGKPVTNSAGAGFGSSDCKTCPAHLYYFAAPPFADRRFVELIFRYRHVEALRP